MTKAPTDNHIIILFDGVCNLCNGTVTFIIRRDPHAKFRFASLQSDMGRTLMQRFGLDPDALHSVLVVDGNKLYQKSAAALRIASELGGAWKAMGIFRYVPRVIRDGVYDLVARNRYAVFGRKDECMIPTPELRERFL